MLIWKGHGILIPVAAVIGLIGGWLFLGVFVGLLVGGALPMLPMILGFWTSALCVWLYTLTLGRPVKQLMVNPHTGQPYVQKYHRHTFFFIPPMVWAILSSLLAIAMTGILASVKLPDSKTMAAIPGRAEFDQANGLLTSNRHGAAHGNTPAAKELAEKFSILVKEYREAGVEEVKRKSSLSRADSQFPTYCHLGEEKCVFLVQVPDLRKFDNDAQEFMCTAAWHTANLVLAAEPKLPKRLAVGVRGAVLYEGFITGTAVGVSEDPEKGIEQRHGGLDRQVVFPFFAPPKPTKGTGALAKDESGSKPTPAAIDKAAESSKTELQPSTSPPAPALVSASSPVPPAATAAALLTEVREWKSADGRPLKASLIRFNDATGTTARFRREDGQEFDVPVEKFSPEDQAELKRLHQASSAS